MLFLTKILVQYVVWWYVTTLLLLYQQPDIQDQYLFWCSNFCRNSSSSRLLKEKSKIQHRRRLLSKIYPKKVPSLKYTPPPDFLKMREQHNTYLPINVIFMNCNGRPHPSRRTNNMTTGILTVIDNCVKEFIGWRRIKKDCTKSSFGRMPMQQQGLEQSHN